PNYELLRENYDILKKARNSKGQKINIIKLPMPEPIVFPKRPFAGQRLPASYANFYIANSCVIVPVFGCKNDDKAARILEDTFLGRKIIPVYSVPFVYGAGAIHCATQQQPV
ncbi:MAG TPA: agmatine deiminase family protein, partial [Candidatus Nanoarchaeia archaeon]|nr:agmatine deiminase family protein [Candidatus Nanoarchaeia archaeon]